MEEDNLPTGVVFILMKPSGEMFLQLRDGNCKRYPHQWCFPGGTKDTGDTDYLATVLREIKEECELDVLREDCILIDVYTINGLVADDHVYVCKVSQDSNPKMNEGAGGKWMNMEEIEKLDLGFGQKIFFPKLKKYINSNMEIRRRVTGVLIKDNKILLIHRIKNGSEYYVYPGGGIDEGEDKEMALKREMMEELNFEIQDFEFLFELDDTYDVRQQIDYTYLIKNFTGELQLGGPEKEIMNENNQYHHEWVDFKKFMGLPDLWPEKIRYKIMNLEIWKK